ncbi:MAG: hypothetical protein WCE46_00660 [Methanoregula sp.]|uniref:hypothetical protein n=1 Tax=Methanoregula sp. TaxID=2052170 RepID=UPI003C792ABD
MAGKTSVKVKVDVDTSNSSGSGSRKKPAKKAKLTMASQEALGYPIGSRKK